MSSPRSVILIGLLPLWAMAACQTAAPAAPEDKAPAGLRFDHPGAPALDRVAAYLCARETDAVIDDEARRAAGLADGQVVAVVRFDDDAAALTRSAEALFAQLSVNRVGTAEGHTLTGRPCLAAAGARRLVEVESALPVEVDAGEAFPLGLSLGAGGRPVLFTTLPDGHVRRRVLEPDEAGHIAHVALADGGAGRYRMELLVDTAPGVPEVALYWPYFSGRDRPPPHPPVYFGDAGHDDVALSHRAEALVQRLRNELDVVPFKVHPRLVDAARLRGQELTDHGALGHALPFGETPDQTLARTSTSFWYARLSEVQAQASTLEEAWHVLLDSPAHRYELVRTDMTHFGTWVVRGKDAAGQMLITVVVLIARRPPARDLETARTELIGRINLARHHRERPVLVVDPVLTELAERLVQPEPVGSATDVAVAAARATDDDTIKAQVLSVDDPLRLAPSGAATDGATTSMGIGLRHSSIDGQTRVVLLFSARAPLTGRAPAVP